MYLSDSKRSRSVSPMLMLRNLEQARKLATVQESETVKLLPRVPLSNIRYKSPIIKIIEQQLSNSETQRTDRPSKDFQLPKAKQRASSKPRKINIREGDYYLSSPKGTISPYRISKIERTKISLPAIQNIERISYFTEFIKTLDNRKSGTLGRLSKLVNNNQAPSQTSSIEDPLSLDAKAEVFSFLQACKVGNLKKVTRMLSQNANLIHASDSILMTGLHWAALRDQPHLVEYLISCKSDVNAVDISNRTPLFLAAKFSSTLSIRILLSHGADPKIASHSKKTPVSVAKSEQIGCMIYNSNKRSPARQGTEIKLDTYTKLFFTHKSASESDSES